MMCEPQVFGLWAGSSLAKMPSEGGAGGPRLGLDTSLAYNDAQRKLLSKMPIYLGICFICSHPGIYFIFISGCLTF